LFDAQVRERVRIELDNSLLQLAAAIEVKDGNISVSRTLADPRFQEPYGGRYWWIDFVDSGLNPTPEPLRSRSLWDADIDPANPVGPEGEALIVTDRRISLDVNGKPVTVRLMAAAHEDEVLRPTGQLRDQLVLALSLIGLVLLAGAWAQVKVGLSPLDTLRRQLVEVRAGKADKLTGSYPSEVAPLVGELNDVLDMREKSLERARRRAGDLAHGLKTPLTVLAAIARDLRKRKLAIQAEEVEEQANVMHRHVERALARARLSTGRGHATADFRLAAERMISAMRRLPRGDKLEWELQVAGDTAVPLETGDLTELLGNLLDNARKWAKSRVCLTFDGREITIEDDGPGVPSEEMGKIAQRGLRLDETRQGSGLGLSIVEDIGDIYGLAIEYGSAELGGLKATIRL
jgi:signal transduction histidine kinase